MASKKQSVVVASATSDRHVALLRGINVGGKHVVPMAKLVELFTRAGAASVRTYIQSGNVVFAAPIGRASTIVADVEAAIARTFGFPAPIVVRSADELAAIVADPILGPPDDLDHLSIVFLSSLPDPARVASLDPARSPPDSFAVRGREIYLRCPNGFGRTKFTNAYFDAKLGVVSTARNWRTALTLLELARA
jgi:uncharacterized protein (DUF1697 family)